jgi:hypothetical protein
MVLFAVVFPCRSRNNFNISYLFTQINAVELLATCTTKGQGEKPLFPMLRPV